MNRGPATTALRQLSAELEQILAHEALAPHWRERVHRWFIAAAVAIAEQDDYELPISYDETCD